MPAMFRLASLWVVMALVLTGLPAKALDGQQTISAKLKQLFVAYEQTKAAGDAAAELEAALVVYQFADENLPADSKVTAITHYNYVKIRQFKKVDYRTLLDEWIKVVERFEAAFGPMAIEVEAPLRERAWLYQGQGKYDEAIADYDRAMDIFEQHGQDPEALADLAMLRTRAFFEKGSIYASKEALAAAVERVEDLSDPPAMIMGRLAHLTGQLLILRRKNRASLEYFQEALAHFDKSGKLGKVKKLAVMADLIWIYEELGMRVEATPYCHQVGQIKTELGDFDFLPLFKVAPIYPEEGIRRRLEGSVLVAFTVDENGFVRDPVVKELNGHRVFKAAALEAVLKFRYAPKVVDGKPVATPDITNLITFEIAS